MKTYKFITLQGNGISFANIARPSDRVSFTGNSVNIPGAVNGKRVAALQNVIANNRVVSVLPEGCTDACSALTATLSARVSFSGPAANAAELEELWTETKSIVDKAISDHKILIGFKPSANTEFAVGE